MSDIACSICMCDFASEGEHIPMALGCGHSFGKSCLKTLMTRNGDPSCCPHDRIKIGVPFYGLQPNYTLISCIPLILLGKRKNPSEAFLEGADAAVKGQVVGIERKTREVQLKIKSDNSARDALAIKIKATESKIETLKVQLRCEEASLERALVACSECPAENAIHAKWLYELERTRGVVSSADYLSDTQELCKSVMEQRVLAFSEIECSFDLESLCARKKEVQSVSGWGVNKGLRDYYVSILRLGYHYLFPLMESKYDIWNMLDNSLNQLKLDASVDNDRRIIYDRIRAIYPTVPLEILFGSQEALDATLQVSVDEMKQMIWNKYRVPAADRQCREFYISVLTLAGKNMTIAATQSMTVLDLKQNIQLIEGSPVEVINLYLVGKQLEDDCTLHDCGILKNSVLHMVFKLRGNKSCFK